MRQTCQPLYHHSQLNGPRCEAAPWDLVTHTRKGNVARATSGASSVGAAAGASISTTATTATAATIVLLLLLALRPPAGA